MNISDGISKKTITGPTDAPPARVLKKKLTKVDFNRKWSDRKLKIPPIATSIPGMPLFSPHRAASLLIYFQD
ncbi:hypothetical protein M1146_03405 [Patescibacteria group bacterium]|nr:hypothetical protein [Patescibacteria group bacterium]